MHGVTSMNLQWKIIFSACLAIAICFTMASAAIESPFTRTSFDRQTGFADAKASAMENMKTGFEKPAFNPPDPIERPEFPDVPVKPTLPEITRPAAYPTPVPTQPIPLPAVWEAWRPAITRGEVEEMILASVPPDAHISNLRISLRYAKWLGILTWFVQYDLYFCPANHDADTLCLGYCVSGFMDAMTGEWVT